MSVLHAVALSELTEEKKTAYNKWHETELERWLSDYNVPYPSAADRKELETLVKSNWQTKIGTPYHDWDTPQLQHYLKSKGHQAKKGAESNKQTLIGHVKSYWTDPVDTASESYHSIKDWFFDRYVMQRVFEKCNVYIHLQAGPIRSSRHS